MSAVIFYSQLAVTSFCNSLVLKEESVGRGMCGLMSFLFQGVITNLSLCFSSRKRVHQNQGNDGQEEGQVGR